MTWSMLNNDEVRLFEEREMTPCFLDNDEPTEQLMYSRTLCGVPVSMSICDLEYSLSVLCSYHFHSAVREVLTQIAQTWTNHRCLADYYTGLGMHSELAHLLERSVQACEYVLALSDVSDEVMNGHISQARDNARSALAKHAASDALREMAEGTDLK